MAQSKKDRWAKVHSDALAEFDEIQTAGREERLQCLQDRRFYSITGAQWEGPLGDQFENKPKFEFNKVHLALIRIFNEYRNNRITVDFTSKDGSKDDRMADTCDGLYRADEQYCTAEEAYDNCFEEGTGGGFGAWRLRAQYENEEDDEDTRQRICHEPIYDADSCVFFDLGAKRQDKSDAKRCYVLTAYTHDAFKEEFSDDPDSWQRGIHQNEFDWTTPNIIWVAELYSVEEKSEVVRFFKGLDPNAKLMRVTEDDIANDEKLLDQLQATGFTEAKQKRVTRKIIRKYTMSGGRIYDEVVIPGRHIPVVPYFGKRWVVDGVERCMGHVRLAKDAQRLQNMLMSWLAEMAARFDVEKPILTPEQIAGHAQMWAEDNVKKFPYLLLNATTDAEGNPMPAQPLAYTKAPNIPPAMAALAQLAAQALEDMLGNQQAGEEMKPNISGKVVELVQQRLDMQTFIYMSNYRKAHKRAGEIWLSMMKDIVTERGRRMKVIDSNGQADSAVLNQPAYDSETAEEYLENDLSNADYEVIVDVGPSSSSQRQATVRALTGALQFTDDPETKQALTLTLVSNLEGEGLSDLRDWSRRKAVRSGVVKPTDEEAQQLQQEAANQKPNPQDQALLAMAEESSSNAAAARASTVQKVADANLKQAQARKTSAETAAMYANAESDRNSQIIANAQALQDLLYPSQQQANQPY